MHLEDGEWLRLLRLRTHREDRSEATEAEKLTFTNSAEPNVLF